MDSKAKLLELQALCAKMQRVIEAGLAEQANTARSAGVPEPTTRQRIENAVVGHWEQLKTKKKFTAMEVQALINAQPKTDPYVRRRSYSNFSAILSRWARESYLEIVEQGSGPKPTCYKIP